jgi:hypothetical protein
LRKLVISNSPSSMRLWVESCREWMKVLPEDVRSAIEKGEKDGDYEDAAYKKVCIVPTRRIRGLSSL